MAELRTQKRVVRWGHGYGVRLTRDEARRLGVRERSPVEVQIRPAEERLDPDALPKLRLGRHASRDHDKIFAEGA